MTSRILIVEDQEPMRDLLKVLLNDHAEIVGECTDGSEALDAYSKLKPDWVLMDIGMQNVDGLVATRRIIAEHPKAKILIVTDYDDKDLREAALTAGASGYLLKEDLLALDSYLVGH